MVGGLWACSSFRGTQALLPVGLNDVAVSGKQNLLAFAGAANFSGGRRSPGVMLKSRNRELKEWLPQQPSQLCCCRDHGAGHLRMQPASEKAHDLRYYLRRLGRRHHGAGRRVRRCLC